MERQIVGIGISAIIIGIGFLVHEIVSMTSGAFYISATLWATGMIALILGTTVLGRQEESHIH